MHKKILLIFVFALLWSCSKTENRFVFLASNGSELPKETSHVDLLVGNTYGWFMYTNDNQPVTWKEEFILPSVPEVWGEEKAISNINITEKTSIPLGKDGQYYIGNLWSVAEGDPPGEYIFNIFIDGKKVKQFKINFK